LKEEKTRCVIALVDLARLAARSDAMAREAEAIAVRRAREATTSLAYPIGTRAKPFFVISISFGFAFAFVWFRQGRSIQAKVGVKLKGVS
jgi:hypothetical protein|tara:strand:- start:452 stop:721 length:270 start_codon:yes stop_codon:yes gene_type:complete